MAIAAASPFPGPSFHIVWCRDDDAAALAQMLAERPIPRAQPGDPKYDYLDLCISKPWGHEFVIYEDAVSEAWLLDLKRMCRTSTHAHARKATVLVCVGGEGELLTGDGEVIGLVPGTVVLIMPGARHRSSTSKGMQLIELETPRDKLDLVRYEDSTRAAGTAYESAASVSASIDLAPLTPVTSRQPRARLRDSCGAGAFQFGLETGAHVKARPTGLCAAICVELGPILRREFSVVTASSADRAGDSDTHLTIRQAPVT